MGSFFQPLRCASSEFWKKKIKRHDTVPRSKVAYRRQGNNLRGAVVVTASFQPSQGCHLKIGIRGRSQGQATCSPPHVHFKYGIKNCLKPSSCDTSRPPNARRNTAWILDPAASKYLSGKCNAGFNKSSKLLQNLVATYPHWLGFKLLKEFINGILATIRKRNHPSTEIPSTNHWGLKADDDGFIDLDSWNPRLEGKKFYRVMDLPPSSESKAIDPICTTWTIFGEGISTSIQLSSRVILEIPQSSLLIMMSYDKKVKSSKKKSTLEGKKHCVLIPADLKVIDLVKAFQFVGNISGIIGGSANALEVLQITDTRTAKDLNLKNGTELVLQLIQ